jgi:hypothetical protein
MILLTTIATIIAVIIGIGIFAIAGVLWWGLILTGFENRQALKDGSILAPYDHPSYTEEKSNELKQSRIDFEDYVKEGKEMYDLSL